MIAPVHWIHAAQTSGWETHMSTLSGDWNGRILGTNNADIFVELSQSGEAVSGTLRINDPMFGVSVYSLAGTLVGDAVSLTLSPKDASVVRSHNIMIGGRKVVVAAEHQSLGVVSATAKVVDAGRIEGRWTSSVGTAGTMWITRATTSIETASQYKGDQSENIVFVMMAISDADLSLEDALGAIKRAAILNGLEAIRVDEIEHSGRITEVVLAKLKTSRFLVCDISAERPNVYYELGYAHALKKPVILAAKVGTKIHFDVADYNVIIYKSFADLEARIASRIGEALGTTPKGG